MWVHAGLAQFTRANYAMPDTCEHACMYVEQYKPSTSTIIRILIKFKLMLPLQIAPRCNTFYKVYAILGMKSLDFHRMSVDFLQFSRVFLDNSATIDVSWFL